MPHLLAIKILLNRFCPSGTETKCTPLTSSGVKAGNSVARALYGRHEIARLAWELEEGSSRDLGAKAAILGENKFGTELGAFRAALKMERIWAELLFYDLGSQIF